MSNQFLASLKSSYAAAQPPPPGVTVPSLYSSRSLSTEQYHPESSALSYYNASDRLASPDTTKYSLSSSFYLTDSDPHRYDFSATSAKASASSASQLLSQQSSWLASDFRSTIKRPSEALYHQTVYGNTLGQSEAWYSANSLAKRPRLESASNLPIYPQRPGEKDCAYYMLTRTCKFGDSCKFDHPVWVPEGGIPDWKEVLPVSENLPERPGEQDCPYFLKTQKCKFGTKCKFNHPKDESASMGAVENNASNLPERPSEPECAFYMKTGKCKFGANCKFHHPKDIQVPSVGKHGGIGEQAISENNVGKTSDVSPVASGPIIAHNSKGLPMRLGVEDCPFYMKTGSCKYGGSCRYNHPDRNVVNPPAASIGHPILNPQTPTLGLDVINSAASFCQSVDPRFTQPALGRLDAVYPQRPGQTECDYYMKTGECKFGDKCKFHHPVDRSAPIAKLSQPGVKLTPAGLPRREGATLCAYYLKTGTCKFGATCKFDHPPPAEVMAMASSQGASAQEGSENVKDQQE